MSINLFIFFVFATICAAILDGVIAGNTGIATTTLTKSLSATATTANVHDTSGLGDTGVVQIEDELMCYSGKSSTTLTGLLRGQRCGADARVVTAVTAHATGRRVYTENAGLLNTLMNLNEASNFSDGGVVGTAKGVINTIIAAPQYVAVIARMAMWDFDFLSGPYVYVKYVILTALSAGLVLGGFRMMLGR